MIASTNRFCGPSPPIDIEYETFEAADIAIRAHAYANGYALKIHDWSIRKRYIELRQNFGVQRYAGLCCGDPHFTVQIAECTVQLATLIHYHSDELLRGRQRGTYTSQ